MRSAGAGFGSMKPLPTDPMQLQGLTVAALCADLFDVAARRSTGFHRVDAIREVLIATRTNEKDEA